MARGIGGEDGPSVWMFVAVVVVWGAVRQWFTETKKSVVDKFEIGQNSGGPMQDQSSAEIQTMQSEVDSWHVAYSALPKPKTYYHTIVNVLKAEMSSNINIDEARIISLCRPLSRNELMAVAKIFGVWDRNYIFGLTAWTGNIFQAFDIAFKGMYKDDEMAQLKKIWAVTKLW